MCLIESPGLVDFNRFRVNSGRILRWISIGPRLFEIRIGCKASVEGKGRRCLVVEEHQPMLRAASRLLNAAPVAKRVLELGRRPGHLNGLVHLLDGQAAGRIDFEPNALALVVCDFELGVAHRVHLPALVAVGQPEPERDTE